MNTTTLIFGGTAAYHINPADFATVLGRRQVDTPYGPSPNFYRLGTENGHECWYGSRHGDESLDRSARFVNHRANLWAARELGVQWVLSWNGVGAINPALRVGNPVLADGLMDWTRNRVATFGPAAEFPEQGAAQRAAARTIDHINQDRPPETVAQPFDAQARQALAEAVEASIAAGEWQLGDATPAGQAGRPWTYVCTEGPRLETAAEIQLAAVLGADVVGMTLCPEVWLAAELGLGYASLGLVTNFATGRWHLDPRRDFGPPVARQATRVMLAAVEKVVNC